MFLTVDFRHPEAARLVAMDKALRSGVAEIAKRSGLSFEMKMVADYAPTPFDPGCVDAVRKAAKRLGYSAREITSGAGHDAVYMARVAPTAMVFTPCVDGISHNESEDMKPAWATAGCNVLVHAVLEKAGVV